MDKEVKNITAEETEALYRVVTDAYKEKYKVRTWIFKKVFSHMLEKMQEESTIYLIMDNMRKHRKHTV